MIESYLHVDGDVFFLNGALPGVKIMLLLPERLLARLCETSGLL